MSGPVERLKQRAQEFIEDSRYTLSQLQQLSIEAQPVCITTDFSHVNIKNITSNKCYSSSLVVKQLINNIEFLEVNLCLHLRSAHHITTITS